MPSISKSVRASDWKSKLTSFLILFLPTAVMVGFIIWAVYESTVNNATSVVELDDRRCLVKTLYADLVSWIEKDSTNSSSVISVSGSSKVIAIIAKTVNDDCDDVFSL